MKINNLIINKNIFYYLFTIIIIIIIIEEEGATSILHREAGSLLRLQRDGKKND